ncbi:MAG: flagellar filament capping protein FliD [Peptostreptococcaceae bacterium]
MSSISSVRIPGLATGMDTDQVIKDMLVNDQSKIDRVSQNQQISKWQQETYREIIGEVKGFYDKYFSATSPDYILGNKSFNTININSSNSSVITATGTGGASGVNYSFEVKQLAESAKKTSTVDMNKSTKLSELGVSGEINFKIGLSGDKETELITIDEDDTVESLIKKINDSSAGEVKASFSDMTGKLTIESKTSGENSTLKIIDESGNVSDALSFLGINGDEAQGKDSIVTVKDSAGNIVRDEMKNSKNSFTIDGITYSVNGIGEAKLTSTQDVSGVVNKMQNFINDYNKIMDNIYDLVTEKKNRDYPPLTDAQREEMSEEEIKQWEAKSKSGILRNDSELRKFMDDMKNAMFGPLEDLGYNLADIGITSAKDYNKQGQIQLDVEKFTKVLEENSELTYQITTGVFENVKKVMYDYAGSSTSVFVKKAGIEKSSTELNNLFSNQIRKQEDQIKNLFNKMKKKEEQLYAKFARLESQMNKLNAQMSYLSQ